MLRVAVAVFSLDDASAPDGEHLSPEEHSRAARFVLPLHRRRFVAGRATLRRLLGERLGVSPAEVPLTAGPQGKPMLAGEGPFFNLSHTEGTAALAICLDAEIGIDIETPRSHDAGVAALVFAPDELAALAAREGSGRDAAFTRLWTRKEAVAKALGLGFTMPFRDLAVTTAAETPRVLRTPPGAGAPGDWRLADFEASGIRGAVAALAPGRPLDLRLRLI